MSSHDAPTKSLATVWAVWALLSSFAHVQDERLTVGSVEQRAAVESTATSYVIELADGDYLAGQVRTRDVVAFVDVLRPDGSRLRSFYAPPNGSGAVGFVADAAGAFGLRVRIPSVEEATRNGVRMSSSGSTELEIRERLSQSEWLARGAVRDDRFTSPTIEALRTQVAVARSDTTAFWADITQRGTPLVESFPGDEAFQLVTFLWRGRPNTRHVVVTGSFTSDATLRRARPENMMSPVAGTDVWYLTVKMPRGARFFYQLSPDGPLDWTGARAGFRLATTQADPLNPRRMSAAFEGPSVAELPGAPTQPWLTKRADSPAGRIERHTVRSAALGRDREVAVYVPPGYTTTGARHDVLVMFDAEQYLTRDSGPHSITLDNLIAASRLAPLVAIFVATPASTRAQDLLASAPFTEFLARELIPWARQTYHVTASPVRTVVAGVSAGGVAAAYAALRYPDVFGNVLSQSGAFDWGPGHTQYSRESDAFSETGGIAKQVIESPRVPVRFYLDAGLFETDVYGSGGFILEPNRHLRDVLRAKGYEVHHHEFAGGHDGLSWNGTFADALLLLLPVP